jgi:hypothetical protein
MNLPPNHGAQTCAPVIPVSVEFLLDETGSMSRIKNATIGGFNDYLKEQQDQPGTCQMTLTKFEGGRLVTPYEDLDIGYVPKMTTSTFIPGGMTNLFDAIVERIRRRKEALKSWSVSPNVLLVVMTDGDDNCSKNNINEVRGLIEQVTADGWTCVYLGADQNALYIGQQMGFHPSNIKSFASAEMEETMRDLSNATTVYRTAASKGTASTQNFF